MTGVVNPKTGFSYDLPTINEDGSPLSPNDISKFQIGLSQTSQAAIIDPAAKVYTLIKDDLTLESGKQFSPMSLIGTIAFGQWYSAVRTVSKNGVNSNWSPELPFQLTPPVPMPPANFTVA